MLVTSSNLDALFVGYNAAYKKGFAGAPSDFLKVATVTKSGTAKEIYPWLGQFPNMREWVGPRVVRGIVAHDFTIVNGIFEQTISVPRTRIEDDSYGIFSEFMQEMGRAAGAKPDELVFSLLGRGFAEVCYDGQYFFDTDHAVIGSDESVQSVSNMQAGANEPWFLLDTSRPIKPLIWQERMPFNHLVRKDRENDDNVFDRDEYIYGSRGRGNAGYGLWQMAFGSKAALTAANYEAARAAMMNFKGDHGRPLGIRPDTLVVSPNLEGAAMRILNNGTRTETVDHGGGAYSAVATANEWTGTAKLIVTPWLTF